MRLTDSAITPVLRSMVPVPFSGSETCTSPKSPPGMVTVWNSAAGTVRRGPISRNGNFAGGSSSVDSIMPRPGSARTRCMRAKNVVAPAWPSWAGPVRRYLAARAFASWCALQGDGLRTTVSALRAAAAVLRVEAARRCASAGRPLDAILMKEAIRAADLLLVHLASPEALARRLSAAEA